MKRIEDKIKEIEKKDKTNRRLYIGVVLLITLLMVSILFSGNAISKKNNEIAVHKGTISEGIVEQKQTKQELLASMELVQRSLRPEKYWEYTQKENTVEGYISYLTNEWSIDRSEYLSNAIEHLESPEAVGMQGWLFVATKSEDGPYTTRDIVEVFYRNGAHVKDDARYSEIKKGDIVQLTKIRNRNIYKSKYCVKKGCANNSQGWRNKTKGFVTAVWEKPGSNEFIIEIKYY